MILVVNLTVVAPIAVTKIQIPRIRAPALLTTPVIRPLSSHSMLYILTAPSSSYNREGWLDSGETINPRRIVRYGGLFAPHHTLTCNPEPLRFSGLSPSCGLSANIGREPANVGCLLIRKELAIEAEVKDRLQEFQLDAETIHISLSIVSVHVCQLDILEEFQGYLGHLLAKVVSPHARKIRLVCGQLIHQLKRVLPYLQILR